MHHLCLVSDQLVPNFLPLKNPDLKPERVTLAVSERMRKNADQLRALIKAQKIEVTQDLEIPRPTDIADCEVIFLRWLDEHQDEEVVLNVTGGTKPMAIAAQEAFRMAGKPFFYVDIGTDNVSWIDESGAGNRTIPLGDSITLTDMLKLYGFKISGGDFESSVKNKTWITLAETLAEPRWTEAVGTMNSAASQGEDEKTLDCTRFLKAGKPPANWIDLLTELWGSELTRKDGTLSFRSEEARSFCNGGWLEHYTFTKLKKLGFTKRQAMMNVTIEDTKGTKNELDCAVVYANRLYVIECKTRNMRRGDIADQAVYKLAELASVGGGLRAKGVLVSYRTLRPEDKRRAEGYGVVVCDQLTGLEAALKRLFPLVAAR